MAKVGRSVCRTNNFCSCHIALDSDNTNGGLVLDQLQTQSVTTPLLTEIEIFIVMVFMFALFFFDYVV